MEKKHFYALQCSSKARPLCASLFPSSGKEQQPLLADSVQSSRILAPVRLRLPISEAAVRLSVTARTADAGLIRFNSLLFFSFVATTLEQQRLHSSKLHIERERDDKRQQRRQSTAKILRGFRSGNSLARFF